LTSQPFLILTQSVLYWRTSIPFPLSAATPHPQPDFEHDACHRLKDLGCLLNRSHNKAVSICINEWDTRRGTRTRIGDLFLPPARRGDQDAIMTEEPNLRRLTITGLAHRCADETERFFQRQSHDPRYCFELFRRAILERSQHAWDVIYGQYRSLVAGWIQRHPSFQATGEEVEFFANSAFEKLWTSLGAERFDRFPDLKSILRYLQMCVHSVLIDFIRQAERIAEEDLAEKRENEPGDSTPSTESQVLDQIEGEALWKWIDAHLNDEKERMVVRDSFIFGLKPSEICANHKNRFTNVEEVYRVKQNVMARLRRDPELRKLLGLDD